MGIIFIDLWPHGDHYIEAKTPSEAENGTEEFLMKVTQQPQNPPDKSNQIWATTSR